VLRRAKALAHFLLNVPLEVSRFDLLAGDRSWIRPSNWNYPDLWCGWRHETGDPLIQAELDEIFRFFEASPELHGARTTVHGHCVPGFEKLLRLGLDGIAASALEARKRHSDLAALDYLDAVAWLCYAGSQLGKRYAKLLDAAAAGGSGMRTDRKRSRSPEPRSASRCPTQELADVCRQVPAGPARNFYEAIQSLWFGQLLVEAEDSPNAQSPGRIDYLLYPYYKRDIENGSLSRERAKELLAAFWLKMYEPYDVHDTVIGGLMPDGSDATNELSYLVLEVQEELGLYRQLSVRYHSRMPEDFLRKACDVERKGLGVPQWFNDDNLVPALIGIGLEPQDARNYAIIGCIETTIPGLADPRAVTHYSALPECLEWALWNGFCPMAGKQMGVETGDPLGIDSYEELFRRYARQVAYEVERGVADQHRQERSQVETCPMPMLSIFTDDCIARALDITAGGARYNWSMWCAVGIPDVANSLAAVKKLVFEEGTVSWSELLEALKANFDGYEPLRQMLINRAPKYGLDDDYVDRIACEVAEQYCAELRRHRDPRGGPIVPSYFSFTNCLWMGRMVAALPEGRKAGQPLANNLCAWDGTRLESPSTLLKSAAKLPQRKAAAGTSILLDVTPSAVARNNGCDPLLELIRTYFAMGGNHCEFTIVDAKRLREAQKDPDRYRNLIVRVAGYSARFVQLDPQLQEHVIERTESYYR